MSNEGQLCCTPVSLSILCFHTLFENKHGNPRNRSIIHPFYTSVRLCSRNNLTRLLWCDCTQKKSFHASRSIPAIFLVPNCTSTIPVSYGGGSVHCVTREAHSRRQSVPATQGRTVHCATWGNPNNGNCLSAAVLPVGRGLLSDRMYYCRSKTRCWIEAAMKLQSSLIA